MFGVERRVFKFGKFKFQGLLESKDCHAGMVRKAVISVPEWYRKANGAEKRELECWKGTGKRRLG